MKNPLESPWCVPTNQAIQSEQLQQRWARILRHLKVVPRVVEGYGKLKINDHIYITSTSTKMRPQGVLDWAHYEPRALAHAINTNTVEQYYQQQLEDPHSDPNVWKDPQEETLLKTYYADRAGRTKQWTN